MVAFNLNWFIISFNRHLLDLNLLNGFLLLQLNDIRNKVSEMSGRDSEEVQVVVSPYRICPLGAHIDHQVSLICIHFLVLCHWLFLYQKCRTMFVIKTSGHAIGFIIIFYN